MRVEDSCASCQKRFQYGEALIDIGPLRYCMSCCKRDHFTGGTVPVEDLKSLLPEQRKESPPLRQGPHFFGDGCPAPHGTDRRESFDRREPV